MPEFETESRNALGYIELSCGDVREKNRGFPAFGDKRVRLRMTDKPGVNVKKAPEKLPKTFSSSVFSDSRKRVLATLQTPTDFLATSGSKQV